jgi:integrase
VFRWGISEDIVGASADPTVGLRLPSDERSRERVYTDVEIRAVFRAVKGSELQGLVPLLFFCGTRSEETRAARWADIELGRSLWTIPGDTTKNREVHPVPLSPGAVRVLKGLREHDGAAERVFPAATSAGYMDQPNKAVARLQTLGRAVAEIAKKKASTRTKAERAVLARQSGLPADFRLHDIRRTVATRLAEAGTPVDIIESILGHARSKLVRTYQRSAPLNAMAVALKAWSDTLEEILHG